MTGERDDILFDSLRDLILQDTKELSGDVEGLSRAPGGEGWTGGRIAAYAIGAKIGEGATANVYRAVHLDLEREVAIKIKKATQHDDARAIGRFQKEGARMAALSHPNVAAVHEVGVVQGAPWIAMELCEPSSPETWSRRRDPRSSEDLGMVAALLAGVAHAHEHGIVHRDLKPENVLFDSSGRPVVVDFGLSRALEDPRASLEGRPLGTPAYMAPEQVHGDLEAIDLRTDVHALGVMILAWFTGRLPYGGADREECFDAILNATPPRLRDLDPRCPSGLDHIVSVCLQKDPADRYPDAAAVLQEFERLRRGEPVHGHVVGFGERATRFVRRRWLPLSAVAVACALGALVILVIAERHSRAESEHVHELLQRALAIERLDGAAYARLHPLAERISLDPPATTDARRAFAASVDRALDGLQDSAGTLAGWRAWMRLLARDADGRRALEAARREFPDNPLLDILAARRALRIYARTCAWPEHTIRLFPNEQPVSVSPFKEAAALVTLRNAAGAAIEDARQSPLWGALSRSWMTKFVAACDAHARGAHQECRDLLEAAAAVEQVSEDAGLLMTLACAQLGDFAAARVSSDAVERAHPGSFINRFHQAHLRRIEAATLAARGLDERQPLNEAVALFQRLRHQGFEVEGSLAELEIVAGIGVEARGGDPTENLENAVERLDDLIDLSDQPGRLILTRAEALQRLARRARERSRATGLLRRAARGYREAARLIEGEPLIAFGSVQVEAALLKQETRVGAPLRAEAWAALRTRSRAARAAGLSTFQSDYLDGMLDFFEAEARLHARAEPEPYYRAALRCFTELEGAHSQVHELAQMTIVIRTRIFERAARPDGRALLDLLDDVDRLIEVAPRFAVLRRFSRKLLAEVADRVVDPPTALKKRIEAIR